MTFCRVLSVVVVSVCWLLCLSVAQNQNQNQNVTTGNNTTTTHASNPTVTNKNSTPHQNLDEFNRFSAESSMIQRALYVLIGFIMIGFLYFLIRTVRLKKPSQRKKYGLLSNYNESVEMDEVDSEEDDTLYEARSLRR